MILEGEEDGAVIRVEIRVLDEIVTVAGVETRVVEERETEDEELIEVSRNFFAQARDGTVCYFGEDVDFLEDGEVVCPLHRWRFRLSTGRCTSVRGESVHRFDHRVEDGRVWVRVP